MNIIPDKDIQGHADSVLCKCNPKIKVENNTLIIIHNAFDHREIIEQLIHQAWEYLN